MPPRATRSGHCLIGFDISANGQPFNVRALACSQSVFKRPAVQSVQKWIYQPKILDGLPIVQTGLETRISFVLKDEMGRDIPE